MAKQINYHEHIIINPEVLGGKPVIKGTRIPVEEVLERLAHDLDTNTLFADYPRLTKEDVQACLLFYQAVLTQEEQPRLIKRQLRRGDRGKTSIEKALSLAGAWADLPSDHLEEELDRIRHASKLTPPLDLSL